MGTAAVLLLGTAVVLGGAYAALSEPDEREVLVRERCTATVAAGSFELAPDQAANAALIAAVAVDRGLPPRAASIAIATAVQESSLRNLDHGDDAGPDSRGLFQQRPSQGWGTQEQVMTPTYAAGAFYDALVEVPGYELLPLTEAAQTVQRSAFPEAYAQREPEGRAFASALTGQSPAALTCTLREATGAGDPLVVRSAADEVFGPLGGTVDGTSLVLDSTGTTGWAVAQWAVAHAAELSITSVEYADLAWVRGTEGWGPATTDGLRITVAGAVP
ncbi:hypothetical protein [Arthrobacter sp. RIT-PI-e]|uniref:hypothetical protein n=1 Tax=Arthrobacter sp. RIT-PI-e TaxID=1681197 RepID=UPI00128F1881|nr:hypothetical protein [Arthrobacter sp. RIT-PI-e]